jgi:Ca2+-binding RTX toxin-like protein
MEPTPSATPSTGVDESFPEFASGSDRQGAPRVLPVIVQPVVPETTGALPSQATATVPRPSEGTIRVIDTAGIAELNFNFPSSDVHIAALDVDLVMVFADNSKLILPNLAVGLLGANPPKLNFLGKAVAAQAVVAAIGQVTLSDATPSIHFSSADFLPKKPSGTVTGEQDRATGQDGIGGGEQPQPPQPILSGGKFDRQSSEAETKTGDFQTPPVREVTAGSVSSGTSNSAITNPSVVNTGNAALEDALKSASFAFDSVISARLLQTVGITNNSGNQIKGATGSAAANADKDASFAAQTTAESLTGSSSDDEIWGDNPDTYPAGYAGRTIEITLPSAGVTASTVTISGVPSDFKIIGANYIGGGIYEMAVDKTTANTFTLKVAYKIPVDGTSKDANGFYAGSLFTMNFKFTGVNSKGNTGTVTASAMIGVRDVTQASDQVSTDTTTGKLMIGLSKLPNGNIINGNGGDDTIHAAAGADIIDGGAGHNRVVYDQSNGAVSVDLAVGKGYKNFASGDTYVNIQDVAGSDYNDTLIGDANDNVFLGGKGADSIDGGGGINTASYATSSIAVTVDLLNSSASGGDATGDVLTNIQAIIGSDYNDLLIAGVENATLIGGLGNDTLSGGIGNDSLDGGAGTGDVLDYSYYTGTNGLTVSIANISSSSTWSSITAATGSDVDTVRNFEGIIGGAGNDCFTGDSNANYLGGSAGDDTLIGGGGADTLVGGLGNDRLQLDWSNINLSRLDGGAGSDTISFANSTSNVSLSGSSFSNVLSNAEYLDFSGTSGTVNLQLGGDDIQKILTGSSSTSANAGVLDLKFDTSGDSLTLLGNSNYSFWQSSDKNVTTGQIADGSNFSITSGTNSYIYVFDASHQTLLATLHYQV